MHIVYVHIYIYRTGQRPGAADPPFWGVGAEVVGALHLVDDGDDDEGDDDDDYDDDDDDDDDDD